MIGEFHTCKNNHMFEFPAYRNITYDTNPVGDLRPDFIPVCPLCGVQV